MSGRNLPGGPVLSSAPNTRRLYTQITFAADAQADGATINTGANWVTSIARTGEGLWTLTLKDVWPRILAMGMISTRIGSDLSFASNPAAGATALALRFAEDNGGDDNALDPDSAVCRIWIDVEDSGLTP